MDIRKAIISAFVLAAACLGASAAEPLFRYGIEWGFSPKIAGLYHYNYLSDEGYRINDEGGGLAYASNGLILANVGVNVTESLCVSVLTGDMGLSRGNRVIPALLRVSAYPAGISKDGAFFFLDGGTGIHPDRPDTPSRKAAVLAGLGGGYHIALSGIIGLELFASLRGAYDHALIVNPEGAGYIQEENIRRNNAGYISGNISVALTF